MVLRAAFGRPPAVRVLASLALAAAAAASAPGCARFARRQIDLLITGGTVIDPASDSTRVADVAIDSGVIVAVGHGLERRFDALRRLDATGGYIIPGLADMHSHFGIGARPPDEDDTTPVLARFLYYGVTTTLNLGSFQAWPARIDSLRAAMQRGTIAGPRLLAAGALITMPGSHPVSTIYPPALARRIDSIVAAAPARGPIDLAPLTGRATTLVRTADDMRAEVRRLGTWGADVIKLVVESGPDGFGDDHPQMSRELIAAAIAAARPFGVPVVCHVSSVDELEACLSSGAQGIVHAVATRDPLPKGIEQRMASAGMTLIPTATLYEGWSRYTATPSLLDEPFLAATLSAAERQWLSSEEMVSMLRGNRDRELATLGAHLVAARDAGVPIVAGTDVGNPYRFPGESLHEELAFYVSAGLTPREALATATVNAARFVGDERVWGSIREGLAADLVVLDADPLADIANTRRIREVIRAGRVVDRRALARRSDATPNDARPRP